MGLFREFVEREEFVEFIQQSFNQPQKQTSQTGQSWSAKKNDIMSFWKKLRPNSPIYISPMQKDPDGSMHSYGEDGIRISGSWNFIASILSRLKELINYENPNTKLRLSFRKVDQEKSGNKDSYVFYLNTEKRERKPKIFK